MATTQARSGEVPHRGRRTFDVTGVDYGTVAAFVESRDATAHLERRDGRTYLHVR